MRILIAGRGTSGSWKIRGEQLGAAIGATVSPAADSCRGFDLAVVVKRWRAEIVQRLRAAGLPIVWDVVDAWPQPRGNTWDRDACLSWLTTQIDALRPAAIVAATLAQAYDCLRFDLPVLYLPHHARPRQATNPVRVHVATVGYEGAEHYLGAWRRRLDAECARRGWRFVVNPGALAELDIVVALRDAAGYAARNWKSNVKLANAQATGTPCIASREAGYLETANGAERWADTEAELIDALDDLTPHATRRAVHIRLIHGAPSLESVAATYLQWLRQLKF